MKIKRKVMIGSMALVIAAAAATVGVVSAQTLNQKNNSDQLITRIAEISGVDKTKLTDAIKQAESEKIDQDVKDGKITQTEADKIKADIASGSVRIGGGMGEGRGMMGRGFDMKAAKDDVASFLGLTTTDLETQLRAGTSLTDIATSKGKTADELKQHIKTFVQNKIVEEVKNGEITQTQADNMTANIDDIISKVINGKIPGRGMHHGEMMN
ncbi:MAG: hypothetical protein WCJ19_02940 [bacterium]